MASDYVFSVRGIVRGYQLFPDQGPLKEFFLDDSEGIETPIRLRGVELPMRDGHDVEVFFLREEASTADKPLLACNYSIHKVEEVREADPRKKKEKGGNLPGCGLSIVWMLLAIFALGLGFFPAILVGAVIWYFYRQVPVDKYIGNSARHHKHRKLLEAFIVHKYGGKLSFDAEVVER